MKKLWVFGDSNSAPSSHTTLQTNPIYKRYTDHLGYFHKIYCEILAEEMGLEIHNDSYGGNCNMDIFRLIKNRLDDIGFDDYVIINLTDVTRFPLVIKGQENLYDIAIATKVINSYDLSRYYLSEQSIKENLINRDSPVYLDEIDTTIQLIKRSLPTNKIYIWSFDPNISKINGVIDLMRASSYYSTGNVENITKATNGKIQDGHLSELGNISLSNTLKLFMGENDPQVINYILYNHNLI